MRKMILSVLIFLVILLAGCIQQLENKTSTENLGNLSLTINITKTSFNLGETLKANYVIENKGPPFKAYEVFICRREDYEYDCKSTGIGTLYNKTVSYLGPCAITEKGAFCVRDNFTIPGNYIYELIVYDCAQIERTLNVNCDLDADYDKIKSQIPPLSATKKSITVT